MLNKVTLIGHVGRDPEIRYTKDGQPVANVSLATNETWKNKAGVKQERTAWHRLQFWGKLAETVGKYVAKGRLLFVEGRLAPEEYEDKNGVKHRGYSIVVERMKFLPSGGTTTKKGATTAQSEDVPEDEQVGQQPVGSEDDIPF